MPIGSCAGKLRSSGLLFHSFAAAGMPDRVYELIGAIRNGFGVSNTVWGVKLVGGALRWEFYFYDYRRNDRERSMTRLLELIRPLVACDIPVNENHHYFMFSIDITTDLMAKSGALEEIHMYIGNPGSTVSSGICYALTGGPPRLENIYYFFDAETQADDISAKIVCSSHIDTTHIAPEEILWPEMTGCRVIVVANKPENDAVYFSGIDVGQLLFFLRRMGYPSAVVSFIEENRPRLDHLRYDVGFDYRMENGSLAILKSGFYGIF